MRRLIAAVLALLVLNTTLVQSAFACEAVRPQAPSAPVPDESVAMHHHMSPGEHHGKHHGDDGGAPRSSRGTPSCGLMLACAAVSAPTAFVVDAVLRSVPADVMETPSTPPNAPTAAPEPPPPRAL